MNTTENSDALAGELNQLLATETRGLIRHLPSATPYLTSATYTVWHDIQRMLQTNADHAQRLTELLERLELPLRPASYQAPVAGFHYLDLGYLLPLLVDEKRKQVAAYQRAIDYCGDEQQHAQVAAALKVLLDDNQTQLEQLESHHQKIAGGTALDERE